MIITDKYGHIARFFNDTDTDIPVIEITEPDGKTTNIDIAPGDLQRLIGWAGSQQHRKG